jgi:RND family efflux transporter MFP subunit
MKILRTLMKAVLGLAFLVAVLWLGGMFAQPGIAPAVLASPLGEDTPTAQGLAERTEHPVYYRAVGSIESRARVQLTARVSGQLLSLSAKVGDSVKAGDLLAEIDSRDLTARVEQARSGLAAAEAQAQQASAAANRVRELITAEAATPAELEAAVAAETSASAMVAAAREQLVEAEIGLGYGRIVAPMDGVVSARPVDPGDMAWPGAPLFTLLDPESLRVEAAVREGALSHVQVGEEYPVEIPSQGLQLMAKVDEVVPAADPRSRTFLVRASLPTTTGLHAGMFARLVVQVGERQVVEVDRHAIRKIGQLDTTLVKTGERWTRRYVTLGREDNGKVEVLSGLDGGETLGWSRAQ